VDNYRRVNDRVFIMTKNACVDDILVYIGQERLPCMNDKQKLHHATK
jgi:hypothetical protein